jgi:hypothetical protein
MRTKGSEIFCEKCSLKTKLDQRYLFESDFRFESFPQWYDWQKEKMREEILSDENFTLESEVTLKHSSKDGKTILREAGKGVARLDRTGLYYVGTEDGEDVYYLYSETFNMIIEVSRGYLEFLEWTDFQWIAPNIFTGNIGYLEKMEIEIKNGTTVGVAGINKVVFDLVFVNAEGNVVDNGLPNDTDIRVYASYNGAEKVPVADTMKYRYFYQTLLGSSLEGSMPADSEQTQEELKGTTPDLKIKLVFEAEGKTIVRTYSFYSRTAASGRGAYVTISEDGGGHNGSFYMLQNRVEKIINDVGRVLSTSEGDVVDPSAKN